MRELNNLAMEKKTRENIITLFISIQKSICRQFSSIFLISLLKYQMNNIELYF